MSKQTRSSLLALLAAAIWGGGFIAQKSGGTLGAFTFNGPRTILGGLTLIPVILILHLKEDNMSTLIKGSLVCGFLLFCATSLQQIGINYTTASKAAFITSIYAILVPIFYFVAGRRIRPLIYVSAALSLVGLYLLNMNGQSFSFQVGDLLVLGSAVMFALQIIAADYYSPRCQPVILSCLQFMFCGILGVICMFIFETPHFSSMLANWQPFVYGGVCSTGMGYTLQILAQRDGDASQVSLILCLEAVFGAIFAALLLRERLPVANLIGCVLIFSGVILSQLPERKKSGGEF